MGAKYDRFGWQSSLGKFSASEPSDIRTKLLAFVSDASPEQIKAWEQSIPWLQREYRELVDRDASTQNYATLLEYQLPRDLRRPDVLVLSRGHVIVLEIKGYAFASRAALDQAYCYARDLAAYHSACASRRVVPILAFRGSNLAPRVQDGVWITSSDYVDELVERFSDKESELVSVDEFLSEDVYRPLPSIVQAARDLFNKQPLPLIKRARACTEPALAHITAIAHEAAQSKSRHLVLLSGVPGSGKTLVGLQLVHAGWLDDLAVARNGVRPTSAAVYLSGNDPLVAVLQHALQDAGGGGQTFVQRIKTYVEQHSRRRAAPPEHLIVFDEAQRAHDAARADKVHKTDLGLSEPDLLIEFCERIPDWCVLVALVGEGQAIHTGEEGGVPLWANAIRERATESWAVHGSEQFAHFFNSVGGGFRSSTTLSLDTEIRFHLTPRVHSYIDQLLGISSPSDLARLSDELMEGGHRFLVTRSLESAKSYLQERYGESATARYGLLASSKDKWLVDHDVDNSYMTTMRLRVGPWYNANPSDRQSCCQLDSVATEFSSQGLELDFALLVDCNS